MKNNVLYLFKSKLILKISGKNLVNFIKRLNINSVNLLSIKYIEDYIIVVIYKNDYDLVLKLKTTYSIEIIGYKGLINYKKVLLKNHLLILFFVMSILLLYLISNIIFSIDIITNNTNIKNTLLDELNKHGIKKYAFKKDYNEIQKIKSHILNKYKDTIDWIEIENIGTKYIIRYEPRITNNNIIESKPRNIVAKKDAIITKINVLDGEIIKEVNTYVKKGEVIVSGTIYLNENIMSIKSSRGTIYGEVWYNVYIKYPLKYYENIETGKKHNMISINFLSKRIDLFSKYKTKNIKDNIIIKDNILPIYISYSNERETKLIDENNTKEEAIVKAQDVVIERFNKILKEGEYIKNYRIINKSMYPEYIELEMFLTIVEDITDYEEIVE